MTIGRADLLGRPHWLLDVTIEGRPFRYSDQALTVVDADGNELEYSEGLAPITVVPSGLAVVEASVAITIDSADDWGTLVARGATLERQPAVLRRWFEGQTIELAQTYLDGVTSEVVVETADDEKTFAIVRSLQVTGRPILDDDAVVDEDTWTIVDTERHDALEGVYYPIPIGRPGLVPATVAATVLAASPALFVIPDPLVGDKFMLIADRRIGAVGSNAIRIWDVTDSPWVSEVFDTVVSTDGIGREVTLANVDAAVVITLDPERQYWAAFRRTNAEFGGVINPRTGSILRGAGELILWLLEEFTTIKIDVSRMRATAEIIDAIKIDTYINSTTVRPLEWIDATLVPLLPIEPVWGPDGLWYRVWRWDATRVDAVAHFDADDAGNCTQIGPSKPAGIPIENRFSMGFSHDRDKGRYRRRVFLRANPDANDTRKHGSFLCARSEATYGIQRSENQRSMALWDEASAVQVLVFRAQKHAWPKRVVPIEAPTEWEYLEEGDVVTYTRTSAGIVNQPALLTAQRIGDPTAVQMELTLLDHPAQTVYVP